MPAKRCYRRSPEHYGSGVSTMRLEHAGQLGVGPNVDESDVIMSGNGPVHQIGVARSMRLGVKANTSACRTW